MATRKKGAKKSGGRKPAAASGSPLDRIIDAGLAEAAAVGWGTLRLEGVAERAGLPLRVVLGEVPTRAHLLLRHLDRVDARVLQGLTATDPADSARDRVFDVMMRRFDVLNRDRDGVKAMIAGVMRDPGTAALALCRLQRSLAVMLAAAGVSADGPVGFIRAQGLGVVGACGLRAWLKDDTADMSKTMAAVDRALARAERFAGLMTFRRREKTNSATA